MCYLQRIYWTITATQLHLISRLYEPNPKSETTEFSDVRHLSSVTMRRLAERKPNKQREAFSLAFQAIKPVGCSTPSNLSAQAKFMYHMTPPLTKNLNPLWCLIHTLFKDPLPSAGPQQPTKCNPSTNKNPQNQRAQLLTSTHPLCPQTKPKRGAKRTQ